MVARAEEEHLIRPIHHRAYVRLVMRLPPRTMRPDQSSISRQSHKQIGSEACAAQAELCHLADRRVEEGEAILLPADWRWTFPLGAPSELSTLMECDSIEPETTQFN